MSTITWPSTLAFYASEFTWGLDDNLLTTRSPLSGAVQTLEIPGARWFAEVTLPAGRHDSRAALEAFLMSLRSGANRLALWHLTRPAPRGTMRSTPTLRSSVSAGATTLPINTTANATVLAGDMLKVGNQLNMAAADATANGSGSIDVTVILPLRASASNGASVSWDKPTALFIPTGAVRSRYLPGRGEAIAMGFSEVFE